MSQVGPIVINAPAYPGRTIYWQYKATCSKVFGVFQLIAAAAIFAITVYIHIFDPLHARIIGQQGHGYGAAIYLLISGILALLAGIRKSQCLIVATLLMTMFAAGGCSLVLQSAVESFRFLLVQGNQDGPFSGSSNDGILTMALMGALAVITLITMILSLVLSCFGCGALCCRCCVNTNPPPSSGPPSYYSDPSAQIHEKQRMNQRV